MRALLPMVLIAILAGCAANEGARPVGYASRDADQCFSARSISSFNPVSRDAVEVRVGPGRIYRLELGAGCFDVDWAQRVALRSRSGGFICGAADAELIVPSVGARRADRCTVLGVRRLSQTELDARERPRRN